MSEKPKVERKPRPKKAEKIEKPEVAVVPVAETVKVETTVIQDQPLVPQDFRTKLTRAQVDIIKNQFAKGASDDELKMFLFVCERTGLDPFSRQIHLVPRWDSKQGIEVRGVIVGIDGFRSIAERTEAYAGNSDPLFGEDKEIEYTEWVNKKPQKAKMNVPSKATVTVKKAVAGVIAEFTATAKWEEYYPGDKGGMMWRKMPENMLGKCAEAKALRKAFPQVMSGIYAPEEMDQARERAPRVLPEDLFKKAQAMINMSKDADGLEKAKENIKGSTKYTLDQRETLELMIDDRIKEIQKDGIDPPASDDESQA